jgi:RNA polymerase sigma-70 factor (ECF subfamily)
MTAETFAQAFAARKTFRGQSDAEAAAWLYAIAARQFSRHLRRGYTERKLIRRLGIDVPAATEIESERVLELAGLDALRPIVARELGRLSRPQRDAIQLRVVEELPYAVVADRLKITEQAARMRVSRALAKLAFALESGQPLRESYEQSH